MPLIRTLIVDDEPLAREKLRALLAKETDIQIVGEAVDGESALAAIHKHTPDLILLDVQMPGLDGFEVLKRLPPEAIPTVIFATAHDHFALQAFEVHAVDYLLKPFDRARLRQALDRARDRIQQRHSHPSDAGGPADHLAHLLAEISTRSQTLERIAVKTDGRIILVKVDELDWIEAASNYVKLHLGKTCHIHRETLTNLEERLPSNRFIRISRSVIVNLDRLKELQPMFHGEYAVILRDGTRLTLSRSHRPKLEQILGT